MRSPQEALARLSGLPTMALGKWPTPIDRVALPGLSPILVKRDDLSEWGRGGAKARKIRYLIGHMQRRGYTDLVTVAGNITNLAFDLLPALDRAGLGAHLHIIDDPPAESEDRGRIFAGVTDRVTLLGPSRWEAFRVTIRCWQKLRARGRRPLWLLPGISHPSGILANACGFVEMVDQLVAQGRRVPSTVFVTAATGTTLAGFVLAERLLRSLGHRPVRVIGVQVYSGPVVSNTRWLGRWAAQFAGQNVPLRLPVEIASGALCGGFGRFTPALAASCERVGEQTGLSLDPIFGGKTWSVMERHLLQTEPPEEDVLYWHCGFTPEWRRLGRMIERSELS